MQGSPMAVSCCYNGRHGCHRGCCSPAELTNGLRRPFLLLACLLLSFGGLWWMYGRSSLSLRLSALDMELEVFIAWVPGGWKSSQKEQNCLRGVTRSWAT